MIYYLIVGYQKRTIIAYLILNIYRIYNSKIKNFAEQLIYVFTVTTIFISMHSKMNFNNLNISKSNLRAYYDFNNVFRKFYYVNDKLLQNENLQVHSDNKYSYL